MRDGRVELKGLALTLFLVVIIHRHLMEGYMVLLLRKIMMEDIPKKIITKRKVILILMKMIKIKIKKLKMIIKKYKTKRVIKMKKNLLKMKMKKKRKRKKKQNQLKR